MDVLHVRSWTVVEWDLDPVVPGRSDRLGLAWQPPLRALALAWAAVFGRGTLGFASWTHLVLVCAVR